VTPRVIQAFLGALTVLLTYLLIAGARGPRAGSMAAALLAIYGPVLHFEGELLPPTLLLALLSGSVLLLARADAARRAIVPLLGAGLLLGLAAAARPTMLLVAALAAVWWWAGRRGRAVMAGAFLAAVLPLLPFALANRSVGGEAVLVSWNGGINFYLGNGANSDSLTAIQPGHAWDALQVEPLRAGVRTRRGESSYWTKRALREAAADPGAWSEAFLRKVVRLLDARETPRNTDYADVRRDSALLSLPLPGFGIVAPLALLGLLLAFGPGRAPPRLRLLLGAVLVAVAAENLIFFVAGRYRLEAVPALCGLAGLGLDEAWRRRGRLPAGVAVGFVLFAAFVGIDWLGERSIDETRAALNRAIVLQRAGLPASSERTLREVAARDPADPDVRLLLGEAAMRDGDFTRALGEFQAALVAAPDAFRPLLQAAQAADRLGRADDAEAYWQRAIQADPFDADARLGYGTHLALRERWDEATAQLEQGQRMAPSDERFSRNLRNLERHRGGS
jgi:4-amino-4-deoxy-L-arabinose transferase-like glycosyltransferase